MFKIQLSEFQSYPINMKYLDNFYSLLLLVYDDSYLFSSHILH